MIILGAERERLISELNLPMGVARLTRGEEVHPAIASRARKLAYSTEPEDFAPTGVDVIPLWEGESSITGFYLVGGEPHFIRYDVYSTDDVLELGTTLTGVVEDLVRFLEDGQVPEVCRALGVSLATRPMKKAERLVTLATRLKGFEVVPGIELVAPRFQPISFCAIGEIPSAEPPIAFAEFVANPGAISAMDIAGGVAFLTEAQVHDHLRQDYSRLLTAVDGIPTFPFAVNGSGSYLLLAVDDSGVWKLNAHMHPVAKPIRIADGFESFVEGLGDDWEAVLERRGGPYTTS